jgi:hypothetical protein
MESDLRVALRRRLERATRASFPGVFETYWSQRKSEFTSDFQNYVDEILEGNAT